MDDREGVDDALAAALDPIGVPGVALGADVPRVEIGRIAGLAVAQPQFFLLAFLPVKIGLRLGLGSWS